MKYCLLFAFSFSLTITLFSQPGGSASQLELWLKADAGVTGTTVTAWADQSGNGNNPTINGNPTLVTINPVRFNYNPSIQLDGTGDFFSWVGLTTGNTEGDIFSVHHSSSASTTPNRELWDFDNGINGSSHPFNLDGNYYDDFGGTAISTGDLSTLVDVTSQYIYNTNVRTAGGTSTKTNFVQGEMTDDLTIAVGFSTAPTIGRGNFTGSGDFLGEFGEIILYDRDASLARRRRIWTYLAVKYGTTLSNAGGGANGDYRSTGNTRIWDASASAEYHNDVIGIGRDDAEDLIQKQSHTLDDTTRVYISALSTSNAGNVGTFTNDESYVMIGHNTGRMCASAASIVEIPGETSGCPLFSRIEREWKITKTDFSQNFNLDLTMSSCSILGSIDPSELRLVVDDNGDFSDGGTNCYFNGDGTGIVISYASPIITISNISSTHITDNAITYMTIGSISGSTPLPIGLTNFDATPVNNCCVQLDWTTSSEKDNDYFIIERSSDAQNWHFFDEVQGAGTSSTVIDYSLEDKKPLPNTSYYRLSQVDFDGTLSVEGIRSVVFNPELNNNHLVIYPNPTTNTIHVLGENIAIENLTLFNSLGQIVTIEMNKTENGVILIDLSILVPGIYVLKDLQESYRIVKN